MRRRILEFALASAVLAPHEAGASEHASARLEYVRDAGAETCPPQAALEAAIRAHLGYDPFVASALRLVQVRVYRRGGELVGHFDVQDGRDSKGRDIVSPERDCDELLASMSMSIAISIDPFALGRPGPPPAPPPSALTPPAPVVALPEKPPPASPADPIHLGASLGLIGSLGAVPAPDVGVTAQGTIRWRRVSLGLEGRADLPASKSSAAGTVTAYLLLATLVPCIHHGIVFGCALGAVGALLGAGSGVTAGLRDTTVYGAAGGRAGVEIPLRGPFALRVHGDLLATIRRTALNVNEQPIWTTPPVSGAIGLAAVASF